MIYVKRNNKEIIFLEGYNVFEEYFIRVYINKFTQRIHSIFFYFFIY